jgi:hypothetical protein
MKPEIQVVQPAGKAVATPAQELVRRVIAQDRMLRSPVERRPATTADILPKPKATP